MAHWVPDAVQLAALVVGADYPDCQRSWLGSVPVRPDDVEKRAVAEDC